MRELELTDPPMSGADIHDLQVRLGIPADGFYGPLTAEVVAGRMYDLGFRRDDTLRFQRAVAGEKLPLRFRVRARRRG